MVLESIKPLQLVGQAAEFKFESKFEPLLAISPKAVPNGNQRCRGNINGQALWAARHCLGGWTGQHKHREFPRQFPSRWQLPVAAGSDSLTYRLACWKHATTFSTLTQFKGQFFWMFCRLRQQQALLFFMWHEIFYGIGKSRCQPKQHPSLCSIFQSVIGLWVEIWLGTKTACSESNPVQSSRSKLMTCPRKVHLLKFK